MTTTEKVIRHYYFSFGSMVNPVSRSRRGLTSYNEQAAILPQHELIFTHGTGDVRKLDHDNKLANTSSSFGGVHGVLMEFHTEEDWKNIVDSEKGYDVHQAEVIPYEIVASSTGDEEGAADHDGNNDNDNDIVLKMKNPIQAHYFQFPPKEQQISSSKNPTKCRSENNEVNDDQTVDTKNKKKALVLPQERYLRILTMGMKYHGVSPKYIEAIARHPCRPSVRPKDYLVLPVLGNNNDSDNNNNNNVIVDRAKLPTISAEEYLQRAQADHLFVLNRSKVAQVRNLDAMVAKWLAANAIGKDPAGSCTGWAMYKQLYEPNLPSCEKPADVTDEHHAWAEHELMAFANICECKLVHVMNLEQKDKAAS